MSNELITIEEETALTVFSSENGLDPYIQQAKYAVNEFEHDLSTAAGRKRTASLANKVAKLKVRLDGMGKDLVSDWKTKAKAVDANRKAMRDELDKLKVEARKPLAEWEEEQERIESEKQFIAMLEDAYEMDAQFNEKREINKQMDHMQAIIENAEFDKLQAELAEAARVEAELEAKQKAEREEQLKRDAAEEARLKAEREAKEQSDRIEREKQDALHREQQAKEAAAQAERDKIAAQERAKLQAEQAEARRIQAEKQAAENAKIAAEQARQAEIERQQQEQARIDAEKQAREADRAHKSNIMRQAKESLISSAGLTESQAVDVVKAIHKQLIANVTINF